MKLSQNEQKALECLTSLDGLLKDLDFPTACDDEFKDFIQELMLEIKDKQNKVEHPIVFMNAFIEGDNVRLDVNQDKTDSTSLQRFLSCWACWDGKQWRSHYEDLSQWTFFYEPVYLEPPVHQGTITDVQTFCVIPERDEWACLYVEDGKIKYEAMYVTHAEANRTANELWEKAKEQDDARTTKSTQ